MKKFIKIIVLSFFTTFLFVFFSSCNSKKDNYILSEVWMTKNRTESSKIVDSETFSILFPNIINNLGKTLIIKNENEIIFSGNETKEYEGKINYYDAGFITYITIENKNFYIQYENIYIIDNLLYIESRYTNNYYFKFVFQLKKVK